MGTLAGSTERFLKTLKMFRISQSLDEENISGILIFSLFLPILAQIE